MRFLRGGGYLANFTMNFPLWFFHTLFLAYICMFFIVKLADNVKAFIFVILILLTIPFQILLPGRPIFHINILPAAIVYMLLGYGLSRCMLIGERKKYISYGIVLVFLGWLFSLKYGGNISAINHLCYYFESFCTIIGYLIIFANIKGIKWLEYIGERSLFILGLHSLLFTYTIRFAQYIKDAIGFENGFLYHLIVVSMTVLLSCCLADVYLNIKQLVLKKFTSAQLSK